MTQRESAYAKFPGYRVEVEPSAERVRARVGGTAIADSAATVTVHETKHAPVVYFPRDDVRLDLARRTDHATFCPFKGEASYWTFTVDGQELANLAWSYEQPFAEVAALRGYVSFYTDRVELVREVCNLPEPLLRERIAMLRREILPQATARETLESGVALAFAHSPALERRLADLVAFERGCCGGLDWTLRREGDALRLSIEGLPPGSDFLRALGLDAPA